MKTVFLFFIAILPLLVCEHPVSARLSRFDSIAPVDTTCKLEVKAAKEDLQKGKITYCHFVGMLSVPFRNENEMIGLLQEYHITYRTELISDVITDQTQGCYCDFMAEAIKERWGGHFIDSLMNASDSLYLVRHLNDTMDYSSCDKWARYPGDTDSGQTEECLTFQEQCDSLLKYPIGYRKKKGVDVSAFADVYFVVDKAGRAKIVGFHFLFDVQGNHRWVLVALLSPRPSL